MMGLRLKAFLAIVSVVIGILSISKVFAGDIWVASGKVLRVVDGDTIRFQPDDSRVGTKLPAIRMVGTDTPETHYVLPNGQQVGQGYWGDAATKYLESLIPAGTSVTLQNTGADKYGRILGRVFFKDYDVNLKMVRSGWAVPYILCSGAECDATYFERHHVLDYIRGCFEARRNGAGIYNPTNPLTELPYEFRKRMAGQNPDKWVGDFATKKLYRPEDYRKVDVCRRIFFLTQEEAARAGYR